MINRFCILIVCLFFSSCYLFSGKNANKDVADYDLDIQWQLETERYFVNRYFFQTDNFLYFEESNEMYVDYDNSSFCISKVDLNTGKYVWKTERLKGCISGDVVANKISEYIVVLADRGTGYFFSDKDGTLITTVYFGESEQERKIYRNTVNFLIYKNYIIWDAFTNDGIYLDDGIVLLDVNNIDMTQKEQILVPKYIWRRNEEDKHCVSNFMIEKDGILYFETYARDDLWSFIYAVDLENNEVLWRKYTNGMRGTGQNCLYLIDNRLYSIENRIGCYDISKSGNVIFEMAHSSDSGIYLGGHSTVGGITYLGGYFYYTTSSSPGGNIVGTPRELIKNIFCIRPSDFKIVWCDLDYKTGSLYSKVVVENNKAFVFGEDRIRVYNAATGKLLGINDEVGTWVFENATTYNGNVIFFNTDRKTKTSVLTAIKA